MSYNLFTIQKGYSSNLLGLAIRNDSYIVAFKSRHIAEHVQQSIHLMPRLFMKESQRKLIIQKSKRPSVNKSGFRVIEKPFDDLMLYPFEKCLGLILPYDVELDDDTHLTFQTHIIPPCGTEACALLKYGVPNSSTIFPQ